MKKKVEEQLNLFWWKTLDQYILLNLDKAPNKPLFILFFYGTF